MIPREPSINERHPPSTGEWNEFERRQPDVVRQPRVARGPKASRAPTQLPALTPEQIAHHAAHLADAVTLLVEALDRELWDARWTNRLMQAHTIARSTLIHAAAWQPPPEAVAASDSPQADGESDPQRESATTAVEACRTSPEA